MTGILRRARARASVFAPSTKAEVRSLLPRRRAQSAWLRSRLPERGDARVLGVGRFDPRLAAALVTIGADIVDYRPANRDANIVADLAVDGKALAGPYDLVVAQEPGAASTAATRMVPTLVDVLAEGGRMVLTGAPDDPVAASVGTVEGARVEASPIRSGVALEVSIR